MTKKLMANGYSLSGNRMTAVGTPTSATDAATRGYVDGLGFTSVMNFGAVGDGTADDTTAIASALASGRTIVFPAGKTFKVSQILVSALNDVTLIGYGASIVGSVDTSAIVRVTGGSRIKVLGLKISHAAATVRNNGGFGLFVEDCFDVSIRDCTISATGSAGMYVDGCTRASVESCTVMSTLSDGIHVTGACSQVTVSDNRCLTTGDDGIAVVSYRSDTGICRDITITGNTVLQSKSRGITCVGGSNVTISGNTIRSTKYAGVYVAQEESWVTFGVSGVTVAANTVEAANTYDTPSFQMASIMLSGSSGTYFVERVTIVGNTIIGGGYRGIDVDGNSSGPVKDLAVNGNHFTGLNTAGAGIEMARADGVRIVANTLAKTHGSGVYINSSCTNVHVLDNIIHYPNQGNATGIYGIFNDAPVGRTSWNSILSDSTKLDLEREQTGADGAGVTSTSGSISGNQIYADAGGRSVLLTGTNPTVTMPDAGQVVWTADGNAGGGTIDTGLARSAAGVLKTTNGSTGTGSLSVTGALTVASTLGLTAGIADLTQIASPANPASGVSRLFVKSGDQLFLRTSAGVEIPQRPGRLFSFSKAGTLTVSTGAHRIYNDTGTTLTIQSVRASVGTAPTGAAIRVDVNIGGTTIFTTQTNRPNIAVSTNTAKVTNMDVTTIADGSYFTVDVDVIGSTVAGADLVVQVQC